MADIIGTDTIRYQLRAQAIAELNANRPDNVPEITSRRWDPRQTDNVPSIAVIFIDETTRTNPNRNFPVKRRALALGIEVVVASESPYDLDGLVEPYLKWITQALGSTELNGLAIEVDEEKTIWETAQMDKVYLRATVRYVAEYITKRDDLTKKQ